MLVFILLNLLDSITTYIGVTNGLTEGNVLLSYLLDINLYFGLGVKMLLAIIIALLINKFKKTLFHPLNIAFGVIVVWNFLLIL